MKHNTENETQERALVEAGVIIKVGDGCARAADHGVPPDWRSHAATGAGIPQGAFLGWVKKMVEASAVVHRCYEASVMGYTLHRELVACGVKNMVVAPQKLCGPKRQKTDALAARALVDRLDRWLRGNRDAFSVVRVPTPTEEQVRPQARLRDRLGRMRRTAEGRGRSLLVSRPRSIGGAKPNGTCSSRRSPIGCGCSSPDGRQSRSLSGRRLSTRGALAAPAPLAE